MSSGDQPDSHSGYPIAPPHGAHRALGAEESPEDGVTWFVGPWRLEMWDGREWLPVDVTEAVEERDAFVLAGPVWSPPPRSTCRPRQPDYGDEPPTRVHHEQ